MLSLQKLTKSIGILITRRQYSSSTVAAASLKAPQVDKNDLLKVENNITSGSSKVPKNSIVAAAFASLNEPEVEITPKIDSDSSKQSSPSAAANLTDEKIINAKTVNGLLMISEQNGPITRKHALKIVSILAEWSTINKVKLTDFENDARFIKLCRILGRNTTKNGSPSNNGRKPITGFRTDDLNTVLGVTGDDEAAKLIASITLPQMVKVMSTLAQKKRRSTPLLRSLAYNISSNSGELDLKQCGDLLFAMAVLNFPDPVLTGRVCSDIQLGLPKNDDKSAVVGSILTSLSLLKYRDPDVLENLSDWILKHADVCRTQDISALFLTLASLNYLTTNSEDLKSKIVGVFQEKDLQKSVDWLNHVWSLVALNLAMPQQVESVLKKDFIEKLVAEKNGVLTPTIKMKLLNINAASKHLSNYKGPNISDNNDVIEIPFGYSKSKQILLDLMLESLKSLLSSETYVKKNIDTKMGFVIDAECVLDKKCNPLAVNQNHENAKRIAIMVHDYHDLCQGPHQAQNGISAFCINLLEKNGYSVLTVPYTEFNTSEKLLKRVQYLEKKLKSIVNNKN